MPDGSAYMGGFMGELLGNKRRTHYCGEISEALVGRELVLMGWVQTKREKKSVIFIDLRDRTGIAQIVVEADQSPEAFEKAKSSRGEFVLCATGKLVERASKNPKIPTGGVELVVEELKILSEANVPPIHIDDEDQAGEKLTLRYRYLELRKPRIQNILRMRHEVLQTTHRYMNERGFLYIDTPLLYKPTPEGAREYLVPSSVNKGKFYALPQSPQVFKQILMVGGADKYYQVAKCFRDEALRADRQPEFSQIDIEMSFIDEEDIYELIEGLVYNIFKNVKGMEIQRPFRRMCYDEAMRRFGSDKPDLRFGFELVELTDLFVDTEFAPFKASTEKGRSIRAINIDGHEAEFSSKDMKKLGEFVKVYGAKGLAHIRVKDGEIQSSLSNVLKQEEIDGIIKRMNAKAGDLILIIADKDNEVFNGLSALRGECARKLGLVDPNHYEILWVNNMPLYEYKEEEDKYYAAHHPFTSPKDESLDILTTDRDACRAKAYDLVINGYESAGGSIRIHDFNLQKRFFEALGISEEDMKDKFGFLLEALSYGTPPHGGIALGLDRLIMLLAGTDNIKDVIAFPKNQDAKCLMTGSPVEVPTNTLGDLSLVLKDAPKSEA